MIVIYNANIKQIKTTIFRRVVRKMQKVRLHGEALESLVLLFIKAVIVLDSKWKGKELPPLHRLFPRDLMDMFVLWYKKSQETKAEIILDEEQFIGYFEELLNQRKKIKYHQVKSKSTYNLLQGEYRYQFSSLRLTKQGLRLYIRLLPD